MGSASVPYPYPWGRIPQVGEGPSRATGLIWRTRARKTSGAASYAELMVGAAAHPAWAGRDATSRSTARQRSRVDMVNTLRRYRWKSMDGPG